MQILNLDPAALISEKNSKKWLQVLLETSATWEVFWIRIALNTDQDPDPAFEVNTDPDPAFKIKTDPNTDPDIFMTNIWPKYLF
jgi:hypothetical protein